MAPFGYYLLGCIQINAKTLLSSCFMDIVASALNALLFLYDILRFNGNICSALRQKKDGLQQMLFSLAAECV